MRAGKDEIVDPLLDCLPGVLLPFVATHREMARAIVRAVGDCLCFAKTLREDAHDVFVSKVDVLRSLVQCDDARLLVQVLLDADAMDLVEDDLARCVSAEILSSRIAEIRFAIGGKNGSG